jgi:hypothetical protein
MSPSCRHDAAGIPLLIAVLFRLQAQTQLELASYATAFTAMLASGHDDCQIMPAVGDGSLEHPHPSTGLPT